MSSLKAGDKILNYIITRVINSGGMGTVYEAVNKDMQAQRVAIKQLDLKDPLIIEKFKQEAVLMLAAVHQHIPKFFGYTEYKGQYYLIMEFIQGMAFRDVIYTRQLSLYELLVIAEQAVDALVYAHTGIVDPQTRLVVAVVHRDIKGDNIMVNFGGNKPWSTLVDFGIAKAGGKSNATRIGTTQYAHPLQLAGAPAQPFFDTFGMGATLLEAFMFGLPEDQRLIPVPFLDKSQVRAGQACGEDVIAAMVTTSVYLKDARFAAEAKDFGEIIKHCLKFSPSNGYATALALHADIVSLLSRVEKKLGLAPSAPMPTPGAPAAKPTTTTAYGQIPKDGSAGVWMPINTKGTPKPNDDDL